MLENLLANLQSVAYFLPHFYRLTHPKDVADVFIVALIIYFVFLFIKQSRSFLIVYAIILYGAVSYLSQTLELSLTRYLLQIFATFFLLIFVVIFQREIRRFFDWVFISSHRLTHKKNSFSSEIAYIIAKAAVEMANKKIGALIVFPGELPLEGLIEGGFSLDGRVSIPLLLSIFDTTSPGHDGAVIIENNRLRKFGVHLPLAENFTAWQQAGTRHRAGAGITEKSDALAIIVSEERGEITVAENGNLKVIKDWHHLEDIIRNFMKENILPSDNGFWRFFLVKNLTLKISALVIAAGLWFFFIFQPGVINKNLTIPLEFRLVPNDLMVENAVPKAVQVTIAANERDLQNLDEKQINAFVNLQNAKTGWQQIEIGGANVSYPAYMDLVNVKPETIEVTMTSKLSAEN